MQVTIAIHTKRYPGTVQRVLASLTCIRSRNHTQAYSIRTLQIRRQSTSRHISSSHCKDRDGSSYKDCRVRALLYRFIISQSLSFVHYSIAFAQSLFIYTPFGTSASHNMQFIIFFASLIAATFALPIPQAGNTDLLSGAAGGIDSPSSSASSDILGESGLPNGTELMGRSPQIGVRKLNDFHGLH
jgi:hypothetical protein